MLFTTYHSFTGASRKVLLNAKKLYRHCSHEQKKPIKESMSMTNRMVRQDSRISNSLYARKHKDAGRKLNQLVSVG